MNNRVDKRSPCQVFLNDLGMVNALGSDKQQILQNMLAGRAPGMAKSEWPMLNGRYLVGSALEPLPVLPVELSHFACRNNQLVLAAAMQLETGIRQAIAEFSNSRIGVVMGTSTSGVNETEQALAAYKQKNTFPPAYNYTGQEIGSIATCLASYFGLRGPAYAISTACSSSGKVFASARGLIELGICDAVLVGGADSLCGLTLGGFSALEAMSKELSNPFSKNRNGINIGEASAVFLMSKRPSAVALLGVGESSDAYHMSAPQPEGLGAIQAMRAALVDGCIDPVEVDYINLHGTGTQLNDAMESHAVAAVFSEDPLCSSTKPLTGHTLGAAGATEAGLSWLLLNGSDTHRVPPHLFDGVLDPELDPINLVVSSRVQREINVVLSNSFAFGGNNVSVVLGRSEYA